MLTDWIVREGWIIVNWWLLATLAGAAVFPLCIRLLRGLPDRGYMFARPSGMLIVAFTFWLLASLGFLENTTGSMVLAWLIVLSISLIAFFTGRSGEEPFDWGAWWRENRAGIITAELVFALALVGWSIVRTYQNGILYTEKDMELAFISSVMRSTSYPPNDPWMAGYAISYYYFGYVIAGMMSMLSGVNSTTGFNMTTAMTFALTALGTFGVVYNLVASRLPLLKRKRDRSADADTGEKPGHTAAIVTGVVGVVILLLMGNWQTILIEVPYETGTASAAYLQAFQSNERIDPILNPRTAVEQWAGGGWWWFRSARVLNDINLSADANGSLSFDNTQNRDEVIDEFPAFSFLLADNHPHVLSLPFTLLAIGLALNTLLSRKSPGRGQILLYAVCLGGLIFLNTWDGPIYMILLIAAEALRRFMRGGGAALKFADYLSLIGLGVSIVGLAVVMYLPFLIGFRSQLGGVLPNIQHPTLFTQFFTHFAPLLIMLAIFLIIEVRRARRRFNVRIGLIAALVALGGLALLLLLFVVGALLIPSAQGAVQDFLRQYGNTTTTSISDIARTVIPILLQHRIAYSLTAIVLTIGIFFAAGLLIPRVFSAAQEVEQTADGEPVAAAVFSYPPSTGFVLLLIGAGLLLTLIPEFVYLRDNFGSRMNTIFKFYYQTWTMWSVASAYGLYSLLADREIRLPQLGARFAVGAVAVLAITGGLVFTVLGVYSRTFVETGRINNSEGAPALTLDGVGSFVRAGLISTDDYTAIQCLSNLVQGSDAVVVQAPGDSYGWGYGSVATLTGIPILFNWGGHEDQWRGATYAQVAGTRQQDIDRLYRDATWNTSRAILQQYHIDYVFFGANERRKYNADDTRFHDHLEVVCQSGNTRVYHVTQQALAAQ